MSLLKLAYLFTCTCTVHVPCFIELGVGLIVDDSIKHVILGWCHLAPLWLWVSLSVTATRTPALCLGGCLHCALPFKSVEHLDWVGIFFSKSLSVTGTCSVSVLWRLLTPTAVASCDLLSVWSHCCFTDICWRERWEVLWLSGKDTQSWEALLRDLSLLWICFPPTPATLCTTSFWMELGGEVCTSPPVREQKKSVTMPIHYSHYQHMLCAKCGFGPSENFTAQSKDQHFAQQSENHQHNYQI